MFNRRMFVAAAVALSTLGASAAVAAEDALTKIKSAGSISIAVPTDYPPYGYVGLDLQPQGLDVDMAKLVAERLGVKLKMVPVTSANRIPYLQTGQVELVISTLGKNAERAKVIDFTHAYAPFYQAVYGPASMEIADFPALAGKTIAVAKGAMEEQELTKLGPDGMVFKRYEDQATATAAYVAGQTDVIATSTTNAGLMAQQNPDLGAELKLIIKESPCFIGIAKGQDALREAVNQIILAAKDDGAIDALSNKYLGKDAGDLPL